MSWFGRGSPRAPRQHCFHGMAELLKDTKVMQEKCCHCKALRFYKDAPNGHGSHVPESELIVKERTVTNRSNECPGYYYEYEDEIWYLPN